MSAARIAGVDFDLEAGAVERMVKRVEPEPIQEHFTVVAGRRYPPKQVLAAVTGLDRADFTTHQARAVLRRLGFGVYRRSQSGEGHSAPGTAGPHGGAEAAALERVAGRWVAQDGLEILFDAGSPEVVVRWLRRHGLGARVWQVPGGPGETGSTLTSP